MSLLRTLGFFFLVGPALGQTTLSGFVYDGNGGPLQSGQVYVATTHVTVPAGQTLTVQPGAILKLQNALLDVSGTLDSLGGGATSHITSYHDDSVGGDSNANGPSAGAPGDWYGVRSRTGAVVDLDNTRVAFAGGANYSAIYGENGVVRLRDCLVEDSALEGIDANGWDVELIVEDTLIRNCAGAAMREVPLDRVPALSGNTATGNGAGDVVYLSVGGLLRDATIGVDNLLGGVLVNSVNVRPIPAGVTLELGPGVIVKNDVGLNLLDVSGVLRLMGEPGNPVVFTSMEDDSFGGDSAKDGSTSGQPGNWAGIRANGGGVIHAEHALVRYSGAGNYSGFYGQTGRFELYDTAVELGSNAGLDLNGHYTPLEVVACRFDDNLGVAVEEAQIVILAGFDSNTATGNQGGDYVLCQAWNMLESATVGPRNLIGGSLVVPNGFSVVEGAELTLEAGTAFKFIGASTVMTVSGKLTARGTASNPVFFSSFTDDTLGGDTNGDGPSFGARGEWRGLWSSPSQTGGDLDLEHVLIRNGGAFNSDNLQVNAGNHRLVAVRSENSLFSGFYFSGVVSQFAAISNCVAFDNGFAGFELQQGSVELRHATASGNSTGVFANVAGGAVRNSVLWGNGTDYGAIGSTVVFSHTTAANVPVGVGNSVLDPMFVDAPNGDLRLALGSPAVDAADNSVTVPLLRDALDAPRRLAPGGQGGLVADMGAFEQARWSLSLTGARAIGEQVTLRIDGEPGVGLLLYSPQLLSVPLEPAGILLISPVGMQTLGTVLVGANFNITIPPNPLFVGVELGIQGYGVLGTDTSQAQLTDLERLRIESALP